MTSTIRPRRGPWCTSSRGEWGPAILLEYVFLEVVTVLRARRGRAMASDAAETLLAAREVEFMPCADLFLEALATFRREDAALSFADAAIVTVARRDKHGYVATFDTDFRKVQGVTMIPG
ncbi:MAG TPA: PIN domain-containing protein [Gemmatimonadaceae bacterium]|nr:PIN domain-containing protein [Gemmatimonadaceae bacterium]